MTGRKKAGQTFGQGYQQLELIFTEDTGRGDGSKAPARETGKDWTKRRNREQRKSRS